MKAKITSIEFSKEFESKHGTLYSHKVSYDNKTAYYSSKKKDQDKFIVGKEAEFTEEKRTSNKGDYIVIKPVYEKKYSPYAREVKKEQSKYSGFAMAYAKDLIVAEITANPGLILDTGNTERMFYIAEKMFTWMSEKDKTLLK